MLINHKSSHLSWCRLPWVLTIILLFGLVSCTKDEDSTPLSPVGGLAPTEVVTDLQITAITADRITISWTAPPPTGGAIGYQVRHFDEALTIANWSSGVVCEYVPPMEEPGVTQSHNVTGVTAGELTYIAIRTYANNGNVGPISKNVSGKLLSLLAPPVSYNFSGKNLTAADIDSDGNMDIVLIKAVSTGNNLYTLRNDGAGSFIQDQAFAIDGNLVLVRAADFNNDGFDDIAVSTTSSVKVLTNDGMGLISITASLNIGTMGKAMQVGDFNKDGFADIITASSSYGGKFGGSSGLVAIYFNDGAGGFEGRDTVDTRIGVTAICLFDADDDGDLDIAINYGNSSTIDLRYNDGTGLNWDFHKSVDLGKPCRSVVAGDLNNDTRQDLIAAAPTVGLLMAAINNEQGDFTIRTSTPGTGRGSDIHLADFDGDGFLDIARAYSGLTIHLNDGRGYFAGAAHYPSDSKVYNLSLDVADFNGDGRPDIAVLQNTEKLNIFMSSL